jgi:hypothetical protein
MARFAPSPSGGARWAASPSSVARSEFLEQVSARWRALDADAYPFVRNVVVARLPEHDDRAEFSAGLELILAGIAASQR